MEASETIYGFGLSDVRTVSHIFLSRKSDTPCQDLEIGFLHRKTRHLHRQINMWSTLLSRLMTINIRKRQPICFHDLFVMLQKIKTNTYIVIQCAFRIWNHCFCKLNWRVFFRSFSFHFFLLSFFHVLCVSYELWERIRNALLPDTTHLLLGLLLFSFVCSVYTHP